MTRELGNTRSWATTRTSRPFDTGDKTTTTLPWDRTPRSLSRPRQTNLLLDLLEDVLHRKLYFKLLFLYKNSFCSRTRFQVSTLARL